MRTACSSRFRSIAAYATALLSLDGMIPLGDALAAHGIDTEDAEPFLRELAHTGFLDVR